VPWNAGVWGWQGLLPQHADVTDRTTADPFLKTAVTAEERRDIAAFEEARAKVLAGGAFQDQSTPWRALLTRLANHSKRTPEMVGGFTIKRLPPVPANAKDGDVTPIFTRTADDDYDALAFVLWRGNWHYVGNNPRTPYWRTGLEPYIKLRLAELEKGMD
jgi:hypothetical protein